jgi:uncharacterized protein with PQ loop repeat
VSIHEYAVASGYLGSALGVVMVVPQITRVARHPSLPGVSPLSWAVTAISCLGWMTYGIRVGEVPQIPGNLLLIAGAITVVVLVNLHTGHARRTMLLAGACVTQLAIVWTMPARDVGYYAFSIGLFSTLPQLYDSVGNWRARRNSGVSVSTWSVRIGSQICWLFYAVGTFDVAVALSACVGLSTAIALVCLEMAARSAAADARPVVSPVFAEAA